MQSLGGQIYTYCIKEFGHLESGRSLSFLCGEIIWSGGPPVLEEDASEDSDIVLRLPPILGN